MSKHHQPRVLAVSTSPVHSFSKQPQRSIYLIVGECVEGDAHQGATVQHLYQKRRTPTAPNRAQVHLFPAEMLAELGSKGFLLEPGQLGDNVLTADIDLGQLPAHTLLGLGTEAVVEVTGLRTPCRRIDALQPGLQQHLWGERDAAGKRTRRAGVMAAVMTKGTVRPGDPIRIELPPQPWQALRPV